MQMAMVVALGAQVRYVRTRRPRHLLTLGLSVAVGLLFFEKALLIVPLVFLVTACLFVSGGPFRRVTRTLVRYWPSWLVLMLVSVTYLGFYLSQVGVSQIRSPSAGEVLSFVRQLVGTNIIPGLLGGPWEWVYFRTFSPLAIPDDLLRWLAWAVFLALVVITVRLRPSAIGAWVILAGYVTLVAGMLAATRLDSILAASNGLVPHYVSDVVVVGALCIGVAMLGLVDTADKEPTWRSIWPTAMREPGAAALLTAVALVALALLGLGAAWTGARYGDVWSLRQGRDYLHNAQADLALAPPGTVFFDQPVPDGVLTSFLWPYNMQSRFFSPMEPGPVFVTEAENPSMFDHAGHIRQLRVDGPVTAPGPEPGCGHMLHGGQTVRLPLSDSRFDWPWVVRIGYLSSGESTAVFRLGQATHRFDVGRGLHQIYFELVGAGDSVELTINDPTVTVCVDQITVGNPVPQQ